jgi:hypothetical protein
MKNLLMLLTEIAATSSLTELSVFTYRYAVTLLQEFNNPENAVSLADHLFCSRSSYE